MDKRVNKAFKSLKSKSEFSEVEELKVLSIVQHIANSFYEDDSSPEITVNPKTAIREKVIVCCECGDSFRVLTKKHLATHGLTHTEYRKKYGYKSNQGLVCKEITRMRREHMGKLQLWEKNKKYLDL